jgi:regulator of protease activity HflC (stomatin/prohibitin superfamily)
MDAALAWVGWIAEWIGKLVPRWVILDTTEGAVKFVRGRRVEVLGPGIHWYWPALTVFWEHPTARQATNLRTQTLVTIDDKVIAVGGILVYCVSDLQQLLANTHNADATVCDIALTAIHDVCCRMTWDDLKREQQRGTLDTKLKNTAQRALNEYGVSVIKTMLTDLAPCRVLKIVQSQSMDV